jgi:hypothetical protein
VHPSDEGYWKHRGKEAAPSWPEHDPVPEVLSTDRRPAGVTPPKPVLDLAARGLEQDWTTRIGYARGPARAVKVGTYKMVESWSVWAGPHPETGWRWMACYHVGSGWKTIQMWLPGHPPRFTQGSVTDLKEFIVVRGTVGKPWFKAIEARESEKVERTRLAARNRTGKAKEGAS